MNIAKELEAAAAKAGQTIARVVLGTHTKHRFGGPPDPAPVGKPLSWERGRPWLDQEFEPGHAAAGSEAGHCRPFFAYTEQRVFYLDEHDGEARIRSIPRRPTAGEEPTFGFSMPVAMQDHHSPAAKPA
jgi:hypothetical protein